MVIPNMVMKFNKFDIFYKCCHIFDLSSALACRMESIKLYVVCEPVFTPLLHCYRVVVIRQKVFLT